MLTVNRVRELFFYDKNSGQLSWAVKRQAIQIGKSAGSKKNNGYLAVMIDKKKYYVHRVIWMHVKGEIPPIHIDHINGDRSDNRIENLRLASNQLNAVNSTRPLPKSGIRGVKQSSSNRWSASIKVSGKSISLGVFDKKEEASDAYKSASKKYFGEFIHRSLS